MTQNCNRFFFFGEGGLNQQKCILLVCSKTFVIRLRATRHKKAENGCNNLVFLRFPNAGSSPWSLDPPTSFYTLSGSERWSTVSVTLNSICPDVLRKLCAASKQETQQFSPPWKPATFTSFKVLPFSPSFGPELWYLRLVLIFIRRFQLRWHIF